MSSLQRAATRQPDLGATVVATPDTAQRDSRRSHNGEDFASAVYEGWVRHRRHAPHAHAFRYRVAMLLIDLAELDALFAGRWLWSAGRRNLAEFRREDFLGDASLPPAVETHLARAGGGGAGLHRCDRTAQ